MAKILVIDDDGATRLLLKRNLQLEGYQVFAAKDGREGLEQAREHRPDLIICDWVMPFYDGVEVCRQLKADPRLGNTFFILLTSSRGEINHRVEGLDAGADEFLSKPIDAEELSARVRAGLRLQQVTARLSEANRNLSALVRVQRRLLANESVCVPGRSLSGDGTQAEDRSRRSTGSVVADGFDLSRPQSHHLPRDANLLCPQDCHALDLLQPIGEAIGAERAFLWKFQPANGSFQISLGCCWLAGSPPCEESWERAAGFQFHEAWLERLRDGAIVAGYTADFPAEQRQNLQHAEVDSIAIVPLSIEGNCFGAIVFENCPETVAAYQSEGADGSSGDVCCPVTENSRFEPTSPIDMLRGAAAAIALHLDRSAALSALQASEARYRAIVEDQTELICRFDANGNLTFANEAYRRYFELDRCELNGGSHLPLSPDLERDLSESAAIERESSLVMSNGETRWQQWSERAIFDDRDRLLEFQAVGRDITERKRAEEETLKALGKEKELNELKTHFISMVSHEFKTPLTTIVSSADLLEFYLESVNHGTPEKLDNCLQRIQKAAIHMNELLEDVLTLARTESGRLECKPAPLNLNTFCQDLVEEFQGNHGDDLFLDFQYVGTLPEVCLDRKLLYHILSNLLSNAIKYSPENTAVEFRVFSEGDRAIFQVKDSGIGIPEEDLPYVFDAFQRCRNVGKIGGTGMGLAIVKRCVELHGGHVKVTSQLKGDRPSGGTTFTVAFPVDGNPRESLSLTSAAAIHREAPVGNSSGDRFHTHP
ncbi:MAG: response regulator [Cyanobacteria bacterium J007]|nr:MAG: response regulator [Cyanobacteria bacterium J007]